MYTCVRVCVRLCTHAVKSVFSAVVLAQLWVCENVRVGKLGQAEHFDFYGMSCTCCVP